jgi:hypothetical protein
MKNLLMLLFSSCITVICVGQTNNIEFAKMINWAYPDSKEEVTVTSDIGEGYKIWSLADGKLLFKYAKGDASVQGKFLRYGIQEGEFLKRSLDYVNKWNGDTKTIEYRFENNFFIDFVAGKERLYYNGAHHKTRQVAYSYYEIGATSFFVANGPDDAKDCKECKFEEVAKIKTDACVFYGINFSPSGKYLYSCCMEGVCMIDIESKQVVWKNINKTDKKMLGDELIFNKMETQFAVFYQSNPNNPKYENNTKGMFIFDVQSGKLIDSILVPLQFREIKNGAVFPNSDMKSFVFLQYCYKSIKDISECSPKAWLVKKDEVIELYDKE